MVIPVCLSITGVFYVLCIYLFAYVCVWGGGGEEGGMGGVK